MNDDLFVSGTEANALRRTIALRENVIRILESDLHDAEKQRSRLFGLLLETCKGEHSDRCGIVAHCDHCAIREALEQCAIELCVAKNTENDTQKSLCLTGDTQKESVWHSVKETPLEDRQIVVQKHADYDERFLVMASYWVRNPRNWKKIAEVLRVVKWAYQNELEAQ